MALLAALLSPIAAMIIQFAISRSRAGARERARQAADGGEVASIFSTHPPTEERIARLEAIARGRTLSLQAAKLSTLRGNWIEPAG